MSISDDDTTEFGDIDPEDEWDDADPFRRRLDVLERILDDVQARRDDRFRVRVGVALGLIAGMVREHREDSDRLDRIKAALEALED